MVYHKCKIKNNIYLSKIKVVNTLKGFTLVEMILVLGIFSLFLLISDAVYINFKKTNNLNITTGGIVEALRYASSNASSGKDNSRWGVKINPNEVLIFKGDSYVSRDTSFNEAVFIPGGVSVGGLTEIVFEKLTGTTSNTGDIDVSNDYVSQKLSINSYGVVNYGELISNVELPATPSYPTPMTRWSFNEGSGCTLNDLYGGNNGLLKNNCPTVAPSWIVGKISNGLSFNGISNNILVDNSANLNFTTSMSVSAWIKWNINPSTGAAYATIINKNGDSQYRLQHNGTNTKFEFGIKTNTGGTYVTSTTTPVVDVWYHLVGTWDGNLVKIYVNGVLQQTGTRGGSIPGSSAPLKIGSSSLDARWFNGIIDEVNLWDRALTQEEVTQVYSSNL